MKKAISVGLGKLVISLLSIYIWRIYSGNLSLVQIGIVTLLINFDSLFGLVSASPFGNFLSVNALADVRNKTIGKRVGGYFLLTFLLSILSFFILLLYAFFLKIQLSLPVLSLFVLFVFLNNAIPIIPTLFTVVNRTELSMGLQVLKSVASVVALVVVFFFHKDVNAWIVASILGVLIPGVVNVYFFRKAFPEEQLFAFELRGFISKEVLIKFILPFAFMQLLLWFFFSAYRIYSGRLFDLEFLGKLSLLFSFSSQVCSAFDSVITQIYQADFYRLIDESSEEKKLTKFGLFLKKVQPSYLLFLFLGFLPYILAFQFVLKPTFQPELMLFVVAWVFNFIRINMNLFGLISQVLFSPKIVSQFVLAGVVLSILSFVMLLVAKAIATSAVFLVLTAGVPLLVLVMLIFYIARVVKQPAIFNMFLLNLAGFLLMIGLIVNSWFFFPSGGNSQVMLFLLAMVSMAIIGLFLLTLQRKLKSIEG
jgi:O-antigen/teichoic acid export membrane protein